MLVGGAGNPVVDLPTSVGEKPISKVTEVFGNEYSKVEIKTDGTATQYEKDEDWEKITEYKYTWDADKKEIYIAFTGLYVSDLDSEDADPILITSANDFVNYYKKGSEKYIKIAYEAYKESLGEGVVPMSFEAFKKAQAPAGMTYDEALKESLNEQKKTFNNLMSNSYTFTYETANDKFKLTEKYTGFANVMGEFDDETVNNWYISPDSLDYHDNTTFFSLFYNRASYTDTKITYTVSKFDEKECEENNLPKKLEIPYTDNLETKTVTLTFTDPTEANATPQTLTFTYKPEIYIEK